MYVIAIMAAVFAVVGFTGTVRELHSDGLRRQPVRFR